MAQQAGSPEGGTTAAPLVLVVEDDPGSATVLTELLEDEGYAVRVMDTALAVLGEVERLRPAAILLDLALPYRSGATLLADLKAHPATASVPVIVVSANLEALPPQRAALATARVAKPFDVADLLAALEVALAGGPRMGA